MVWKATCKKSRRIVALKKIFDAFQNSTDAQVSMTRCAMLHRKQPCQHAAFEARSSVMRAGHGDCTQSCMHCFIFSTPSELSVPMQRTFREIMFLQELTTHDNIIKCALLTARTLQQSCAAAWSHAEHTGGGAW